MPSQLLDLDTSNERPLAQTAAILGATFVSVGKPGEVTGTSQGVYCSYAADL